MGEVLVYGKESDLVHILAGNVVLVFGRGEKNKIIVLRKYKPEARIHDPGALDVAPQPFREACRLAAQILNSKPKTIIQGTLF